MTQGSASAREITKTITTALWSASMVPIRAALSSALPQDDASATADAIFHVGDTIQRGIVDLVMAAWPGGADVRWGTLDARGTPPTRPDATSR
jgi:hypothetical protein